MRIYTALFALLAGLAFAGCAPGPQGPAQGPAPTAYFSYPLDREVTDYSDATGRTAAVDSIEVRARVWGYLDKVNFKEGQLVKKGEVLFEIDPRTYKAALNQAESNVVAAEARLRRLEEDLGRAQELVTSKALSRADFDKARGDRDETAGSILALKAAVEQAKLDYGFTKVTAEVSGRVGRAIVTPGNLVQAGPTGGTVLTTLVSVDPIYAYFDVDEHTVLRVRALIREGKFKSARDETWPVYVGLANEDGFPHEGTIDFVDNQVNPKTGTLRIRGVFRNKDEALTPGYFVRVRVPLGRPHKALLVSDRAIDTDQGKKIVYVIGADKKVEVRTVQLGSLHAGYRAVEAGLKAGDRVIVTGLQQIRPGMLVEPSEVEMPRSPVPDKSQK
jgi:RND family efflux transporter MFP subunit